MYIHETEIESTYERHTALLEELRDCLEMERESLMQVDVDLLWELMEKKNGLAIDVERTGNEIRHLLEARFPGSRKSQRTSALEAWPWYREYYARTSLLKEDIRVRLEENQVFMSDSLRFFDDLMHIIVQRGGKGEDYQHLQSPHEKQGPRIYHRAV